MSQYMAVRDKKTKKVLEEIEKLDVIGQESEKKAVPHVREYTKERKMENDKIEEDYLVDLDRKSRFKFKNYKQRLVDIISEVMINRVDVPKGWEWNVWTNTKGIGISIKYKQSGWNHRAFAPCNDPKFDLEAASVLCEWAQNWFDRVEQEIESYKVKKSNGIVNPDGKI